jgi:hypothetical protein
VRGVLVAILPSAAYSMCAQHKRMRTPTLMFKKNLKNTNYFLKIKIDIQFG